MYSHQVIRKVRNSKIEHAPPYKIYVKKYMKKTFFLQKELHYSKKQIFSFKFLFFKYINFLLQYIPGIDRVIHGKRKYAFIMESGSSEYHIDRKCNLIKIGSMIESREYGIAMPRSNIITSLQYFSISLFLYKPFFLYLFCRFSIQNTY